MKISFTTCKLIFDFGMTKEGVEALLKKYTESGTVATFNPDQTVGCNRTSFAVVDVPEAVVKLLYRDGAVKEVDSLSSYSKAYSTAESCGPDCGCGP